MADIFTKEKRSAIMSQITGKNTKPEIIVRSLLHRAGYRFRLHSKNLPGKPDIVLPKHKVVIFVHGCYWHRHKICKRGQSLPSTNVEFWKEKFRNTVKRDFKTQQKLKDLGWHVITIWACELDNMNILTRKLQKMMAKAKEVP